MTRRLDLDWKAVLSLTWTETNANRRNERTEFTEEPSEKINLAEKFVFSMLNDLQDFLAGFYKTCWNAVLKSFSIAPAAERIRGI